MGRIGSQLRLRLLARGKKTTQDPKLLEEMLRRLSRCSLCSHHRLLNKRRHGFVVIAVREHYYRVVLVVLSCLLLLQYGFNVVVIRRHYLVTNLISGYVGNRSGVVAESDEVGWGDGAQRFWHFLLRAPKLAPLPLCAETPPGLG